MPREDIYETAAICTCISSVASLILLIFGFTSDCIWCYPVSAVFFLPLLATIIYCCKYNDYPSGPRLPDDKCCICEWGCSCKEDCCDSCNKNTSCLCICEPPKPKPAPKPKPKPAPKPKQETPPPAQAEALPTPQPLVLQEVVVSA